MYDFDQIVDRRGSACVKWDVKGLFGVGPDDDLIPMWIADMDFAVLPEIQTALIERAKHPVFGYNTPTDGCTPALCSWYERRHQWVFTPDEVVHGIGVVTMMRFVLEKLTQPQDKVMVFSPVYDPFFAIVNNTGRSLVDVPMDVVNGSYQLDMAKVEEEMKQGVKLLILCNPHNPLGKVWTKEELTQIADLCAKYKVYIFSDEVHGDIVMEGKKYTPMGTLPQIQDLLIVYTAISKSFNLAGLHQSAIIVPNPDLRKLVDAALKSAWIMGANAMAFPAMEAAYSHGDTWSDELNAYITENVHYIQSFVKEKMPKIGLFEHEGTFLMWFDMRCFQMSSNELMVTLGRECGLGFGNGSNYGKQCDGFMRVNVACPRSTVEKAMNALKIYYDQKMEGPRAMP